METKLRTHLDKLQRLNYERKVWLALSAFVVVAVLTILGEWSEIAGSHTSYLLGSIGLVLSVSWWYWTMRLVRHLLESKTDEYILLNEVIETVRNVKEDVKKLK